MGWLLPQGDRFGGALDAAAKMFSKAFDSGIIPMEFVNKMKKEGKLIMGIGHRVKSVSCLQALGQQGVEHSRALGSQQAKALLTDADTEQLFFPL